MVQDWVASIIKEGIKFILDFTTTFVEGETLLGEIQILIPRWEADQNQCQAIVFQVNEVAKCGVLKFLGENPMKTVDLCMLFILKSNMGLEESINREAIEEMQSVETEIARMHKKLLKDMNIVNPTWIPQFKDGNIDSKVLTKSFNDAIMKIKDSDKPTASDFTTLEKIKSMLYFIGISCHNKVKTLRS